MLKQEFEAIYQELMDENPFAARAALKVLKVEFTEEVPTLAVTLGKQSRLLVNLEFVSENCKTGEHVKAVICHEFLHILLRHTERFKTLNKMQNLALDVVINAIIHRELGRRYSSFMSAFYSEETGIARLLRPPEERETYGWWSAKPTDMLIPAWKGVYDGRLVADDILELAADLGRRRKFNVQPLLGGHQPLDGKASRPSPLEPLPGELADALDRALKSMNGDGIWRMPNERGVGASAYSNVVTAANDDLSRWRRETYLVLKKHLVPDKLSTNREPIPYEFALPVLSTADRRAALRCLWSPFLPEAVWTGEKMHTVGTAQIYLDVSGSMSAEMPQLVALLGQLGRYIKRPFWAFSDEVAKAVIEQGQLRADTTGGTSMACVLEHIEKTRPASAVVITDGYIEPLEPKEVQKRLGRTRLHAIVSRDGSPIGIANAGIPYTQLARIPK